MYTNIRVLLTIVFLSVILPIKFVFDDKNDSNSNKGIRAFPPSNHCTLIYTAEYISNIYIVYIFVQLYHFITADGDCSHEIKRRLHLGRKVMSNLDSIFKSRDITLPTWVRLVKAMVFPVVMYGCESWTVKKAERQRIDAFEVWCWRRLL